MRKKSVPIVSGNTKYMGLSVPEWTLTLSPCGFYFIVATDKILTITILIHAIIIFLYIFFVSKLEDNILQVILRNMKIPSIVYGYFKRPIPINKFTSSKL